MYSTAVHKYSCAKIVGQNKVGDDKLSKGMRVS
jgi:hypothetical protein